MRRIAFAAAIVVGCSSPAPSSPEREATPPERHGRESNAAPPSPPSDRAPLADRAGSAGPRESDGATPRPDEVATVDGADVPGTGGDDANDATAAGDVTVLSLNLHCFKTSRTAFASNEARFDAIAEGIRAHAVDVVLAQESCERPGESTREALERRFAIATGAAWSSVSAFAHSAWEGSPDEADEHLAIFARGALRDATATEHRAPGSSLRRVMLGATVDAPAVGAVRVWTLHLDHANATAREEQAREAASLAMAEGDSVAIAVPPTGVALPLIVGGDFNARQGTPTLNAMRDAGFFEASASPNTRRIDHIFAHRSAPLRVVERKVIFTGRDAVSDHPGVLVRFAAANPAPVRLTRVFARGERGARLTVRGDTHPLAWDRGFPTFERAAPDGTAGTVHAFVTSELGERTFSFKFLRNDRDWQLGDDMRGAGGGDTTLRPEFP
jgi:endonuclease/exonuclease/phosphatase family metal-dependent hydrolase